MPVALLRLAVLSVLILGAMCAPAMAQAPADPPDPPPTLTGQDFVSPFGGDNSISGVCRLESPSVFDFEAAGPTTGPYTGTLTTTGSFTLGATFPRQILAHSQTLAIESPAGSIVGTLNGPGKLGDAFCSTMAEPDSPNVVALATFPYEVMITTEDGRQYRDRGTADQEASASGGAFFVAYDNFVSDLERPEAVDEDDDGVNDGLDNCLGTANSDQGDQDGDAEGDACDSDVDGDGVDNSADNCPLVANLGQADFDSNGIGDACDPTFSSSGTVSGSGVIVVGGQSLAFSVNVRSLGGTVTGGCSIASRSVTIKCVTLTDFRRSAGKALVTGRATFNGRPTPITLTIDDKANPNGAGKDSFVADTGTNSYGGTVTVGNVQVGS